MLEAVAKSPADYSDKLDIVLNPMDSVVCNCE